MGKQKVASAKLKSMGDADVIWVLEGDDLSYAVSVSDLYVMVGFIGVRMEVQVPCMKNGIWMCPGQRRRNMSSTTFHQNAHSYRCSIKP